MLFIFKLSFSQYRAMARLLFVLFCLVFYVLVTRLSYDSNVKKKAEIHVACFPELGVII